MKMTSTKTSMSKEFELGTNPLDLQALLTLYEIASTFAKGGKTRGAWTILMNVTPKKMKIKNQNWYVLPNVVETNSIFFVEK